MLPRNRRRENTIRPQGMLPLTPTKSPLRSGKSYGGIRVKGVYYYNAKSYEEDHGEISNLLSSTTLGMME
jgi:hypothetical protein